MAQSSEGSVENLDGLLSGRFTSGSCNSDIAFWANSGTGIFQSKEPVTDLGAVAALYPEHIQLIARTDTGIAEFRSLRGKHLSMNQGGSCSYANALQMMKSCGLSEGDIVAADLKSAPTAEAMIASGLYAFSITAGHPRNAIIELADRTNIKLVPIDGDEAAEIVSQFPFYSPAGAHVGIDAAETLAVGAQWVTTAKQDEELIYAITKALWNKNSRRLLDLGHSKGASVTLESALDGIAFPLHPGAERHYREVGLIQ